MASDDEVQCLQGLHHTHTHTRAFVQKKCKNTWNTLCLHNPKKAAQEEVCVQALQLSYLPSRRVPVVEVLLVGIHPNLSSSHGILEEVWPRVRRLLGEHVANVRAGEDLQAAPALPHLGGG